MESVNDSVILALTCEEHKSILTAGLQPYQVLSFTAPLNTKVWVERDEAWKITFNIYIGVSSIIFIMLGLLAIMLLIKKDCLRLRTKTFFAIYFATAVFGFSRTLCLVLDPYGLLGYIGDPFPAWFIVSRMLGALGFPSLVANTTLIIFTLLKVAKAEPGVQWYHHWKYTIPILLVPYAIAFVAELIANFTPYPGLLIVVVCEVFFALWGLLVCVAFLFAGNHLLRQMQLRGRKTVRISAVHSASNRGDMEAQMATRHQFALREQQRHQFRTRRTTRKITIITYGTALFTISYSVLAIAGAIMISILLYHNCLGFNGRALPSIWLAFEACKRVNEIVLVVVLLYSITDMAGMMKFICGKFCKKGEEDACNSQGPNHLCKVASQMSMLSTSTERQPDVLGSVGSLNEREDFILSTSSQSTDNATSDRNPADSREENHESRHSETPSQYHLVTGSQTSSPSHTESSESNSITTEQNNTASVYDSASEIVVLESPTEDQSLASVRGNDVHHSQLHSEQRSVATQTSGQSECGTQTMSDGPTQNTKPVPKPRKSKPKKSRNQVLNEQRIAALRLSPHHHHPLSNVQSHILRKQTI